MPPGSEDASVEKREQQKRKVKTCRTDNFFNVDKGERNCSSGEMARDESGNACENNCLCCCC